MKKIQLIKKQVKQIDDNAKRQIKGGIGNDEIDPTITGSDDSQGG